MNDSTEAASPKPTVPEAADAFPQNAEGFAAVEKLNIENAELKDRLLRALADVENMRRRSEREAADARTYSVTAFARDLLPVADNLGRALESSPPIVTTNGAFRSFVEGVELTARELHAVLNRHGVKEMEPKGEKFDPNFQQAIFEVPSETLPAGIVTEVVQTGWKIGERVLRPALVGVSKGPPKAER